MAKRRRGTQRRRGEHGTGAAGEGSGGFLGQIGLFETANGVPHGPAAIGVAILMAILILPVARVVRILTRR